MKLIRHPGSSLSPAETIDVVASRLGKKLSLVFAVTGDVSWLRLPAADTQGERRDGLWRHSCFEAFVRLPERNDYLELNLSPSGDWAVYRFDSYRVGMASLDVPPPSIETQAVANQLSLVGEIDFTGLEGFDSAEPWHVGLSAVIEGNDGSLSYWALAHPTGAADFHHPDCFVLELPPAGEP